MSSLKLSFVLYILVVHSTKCFFYQPFFLSHLYRAILVYLIPVKMLLVSVRNLCIKQAEKQSTEQENLQYLMVESATSAGINEFDPKCYML